MSPAEQCPLCGENNQCAQTKALVTGQPLEACWCFTQIFPPELLAKAPPESRQRQCICQACAKAQPHLADPV